MRIAIIGLPNSGKTTVFNALTRGTAETTAFASGQLEPNLATVKVPDTRLDALARIYKPRKLTPADVQYVDVAGISGGAERRGSGLPPALLNYIGGADALLQIVRAFDDQTVPHPDGSINIERDIASLELELAFSDLAIIERRLTRLNSEITKMATKERELRVRERDLLLQLQQALESETPIRAVPMEEEDARLIRGYQFLTAKPMLTVINIGEDQLHQPPQPLTVRHSSLTTLCGKIEAELAQLADDDAHAFMEDLGIKEPARDRVIRASYDLLGLISFLTAGEDEVRAWTIRRNTPAVEAAGTIHSDIQRGFIRAQVVAFEDLISAGSEAEARKAGTLRMEGKQYIVKDGDICHFLFNV